MTDTVLQEERAHFQSDLEKVSLLDGPTWLRDIRKQGAARFESTAFPHYKEEAWRYTNLSPIVKTPFRSIVSQPAASVDAGEVARFLYDEPGWTQLVFVDGLYSAALSRTSENGTGAYVGSIAEAIAKDHTVVKENLDHFVDCSNAFIPLNAAFLQDGAFCHVPPGTHLESPIHFIFVSTGAEAVASHPRNLFVLGESSSASLVETHVGLHGDAAYLSNGVTEIVLEDNARLAYHKIVDENPCAYHLGAAQIRQGRDSYFNSFVITLGGQIVRNEIRLLLDGEGGECSLNGLYLNDGGRLIDNALNVVHAKSHCRSRMAYKGVLDGESNSVFTGKVYVHSEAQQTDSNQLNNNVLLSEKATIDTRPQLEIFADDVKCTHGATVGGFPDELTFYFQSRGMSAATARGILTYGFADDVVNDIEIGPLHDRLDRYIFEKYSPK